ncbi:sensor domain-containing diguanylate cyclase [Paraburkholderia oxyphila]|uniref:sensor domain-containing diguanylate cyclase n=1 Tax=Paraburkholderia oxyphila TaxID=614212 RepID=UPI001FE111CA|nr:sensor domain-containing diguanylate cyclase [Paraburkholderia oxyphila]
MSERVHKPVREPSTGPSRRRVFAPHLRLRVRHWILVRGKDATRLIGRNPFFAGLAGTLIATLMAALTYTALYAGRAEELRHAVENSENIVRLVSSDIARNVELYDLSLRAAVSAAQQPETWALPQALRQRVLFDRATAASFLGGAYVLDAQGRLKASQSGIDEPGVSFADRDYFLAQQRNPDAGLFISKPYQSRLRHGVLSIALTRRIDMPDGAFAGVALVAVRLDYFQQLVDRVDIGRRGGVFIIMQDGTLLASKPPMPLGVGADYSNWRNYKIISRRDAGTFTAHAEADGVERVYTYAHVANTPIIVGAAPAVGDILAAWRRRAWFALVMTTLFGGAWVGVSWVLAFALRDKIIAEGELQRLAVTDPLTGLANRRALDQRLVAEWHRASREQTPLSVLFFDVDHFKLFNDTYGHAAGDEVLMLVAERIASGTRRTSDMAARYGGEEFAVLLPGTALQGARKVADKIRRRIETSNLAHSGSRYGRVTVSVGCASCEPPVGDSGAKLLAAADALLYEAKAAGRNQVQAKQWTGEAA